MRTFHEFLNSISLFPGSMVSSDSVGAEAVSTLGYTGRPNHLSDTLLKINDGEFQIPTVKIIGTITNVDEKKNPIEITINKKTKIYQNRTQFDKIRLNIKPNKSKVEITFQKHPENPGTEICQIQNIRFLT